MAELSQAELGIQQLVAQGIYDRGFLDGQNDAMRKLVPLVLKLGQSDNEPPVLAIPRASNKNLFTRAGRAARGTVAEFVAKLLGRTPGLSQREIEIAALDEEDISPTSIGNELRRNEGSRYVKDEQRRWYVIGREQNPAADRQRNPIATAESPVDSPPERLDDPLFAAFATLLRENATHSAASNTTDDDLNG